MLSKRVVPSVVRDRLRPTVQQIRRLGRRLQRQWADSSFQPRSKAWHALKQSVDRIDDPAQLYQLAAQEFGILQIEEEIIPFLNYVRESRPRCVGEIGVKHGGNTFLFMRLFAEATQFLGIDLVLQNIGKARFLARPGQRLDVIEGSSYSAPVVSRTRRILHGNAFDFLFIDGDHEYEGVRADFLAYSPLVRPGGLIAFHDIVPDEFARTGRRTAGSLCYGGGVHRLWSELRGQYAHREFVKSWDQHGFGIGVLQLPTSSS